MRRRWVALLAVGALCLLLIVVLHRRRSPAPTARPPEAADKAGEDTEPAQPTGTGFVSGRVMGKYGTILGVPVRVLVDGTETVECRTDGEGRYRVEAPAGIAFDLEAKPESWTQLEPMRRRLTVEPGAETDEDFVFGTSAGASGRMEGPVGQERVTLFAIRVEDYPPSPGGWTPVGELRQAPKLIAEASGTCTFAGLEPSATYRIAVDGYEWGLTRPVFLAAGDTGKAVPVERLLHFVVEVFDIEGGEPLARFTANVIDRTGQTHDRLESHERRLVHRVRHPEQNPPDPPGLEVKRLETAGKAGVPRDLPSLTGDPPPPWKLVVEAEGYLGAMGAPSGMQRFFLQRVREPNVLLRVEDDDGVLFDGELEGAFEAAEQPDGKADARVAKDGPGRFRAVLPAGAWRIRLQPAGERYPRPVHVDIDVPKGGTVTVEAPRLPPERP